MVRLDKIYTRGGDGGSTSLGDGQRVSKASPRVAAYGEVDEANAALGVARLHADPRSAAILARIQNDLFDLGADLCVPPSAPGGKTRIRVAPAQVAWLERTIDALNAELAPLDSFVLPGGSAAAAHLHVARTVVRKAERLVVELNQAPDPAEVGQGAPGPAVTQAALAYLNRLSDLLFVMARHANDAGRADLLWRPRAYAAED